MSAPPAPTSAAVTGFDSLPDDEARRLLLGCLSVPRWAEEVAGGRPYGDWSSLRAAADSAARSLSDSELDQALAGHPRIGERATAEHSVEFSAREQAGVDPAEGDTAARLAAGNRAYEARFDRVFLIRAAGRSASEILAELDRRLGNSADDERGEVVDNLREIALLRLEQVVS